MKNKKKKKIGLFMEKLAIGSFLSLFVLGPILCRINREDIFIVLFIAVIILMMILSVFSKNTKGNSKEIAEYYNLKDLTHLSDFYGKNAKASNASSLEESIKKQIQTYDPLFY